MISRGPIRVCHLVSDDAWGGAEAVVAGLLRGQRTRLDLSIRVLALNEGRLTALARELGIPATVIPETGRRFGALLRDVRAQLAANPPDLVHSHRYKENLLSYLAARRCGARSVVTLHGEELPEQLLPRLKVAIRQRFTHFIARRVGARFAAVSGDLRTRLGLSPEHCTVIPNGVRIPDLARSRVPGNGSRPLAMGWVGRMVPVKGLPILLEALTLLPPALGETRLLLVGDGPERPALEAMAADLRLSGRMKFPGFVSDPAPLHERMDLFVLPSLHEGVPVAILEAMAAGIPCVAAAVGGLPEVEGGESALRLVRSREPADWAAAIGGLLADPVSARVLGMRGRARVASRYALGVVLEAYSELYASTLASDPLSPSRDCGSA